MISVDTGREGSFSALSRIPVLFLLLMIIALYPFPASGADDVAILRAAERAASGTATEADEALLFIENKRMNHLAMEGTLDGETYRKVQGAYDKKNRGLAADAAAEAGLSAEQGRKRDSFRPGTDTDVQLRGKELSAGDVERARKAYNSRVEAYLRESGLAVERGVNWAARTETDIMPSPADMKSPGEFSKAASYINGDGGNMYASPLAAEAQGKIDRGDPVGIAEGRAYAEEMKSRIEAMKREKASLMKKYTASAEPADRSFLSAEIRKTESHQAKYIDRINKLERSLGEPAGLPPREGSVSPLLEAAKARDPGAASRRGEAAVDALSGHLTEKALKNYASTLGEIAAASSSPESRSALKKAAAETLKGLPPSRLSDALAEMEARHGSDFAREMAAELKKTPAAGEKTARRDPRATASGRGSSLLRGAGIAAAVIGGYNALIEENRRTSGNPDFGRVAIGLAYDMTVRGTAEAVTTHTAAYTKAEVERLREYYKNRGEDPDSLGVKMKIAAEAAAKGTAYGTVRGGYEFAKAAGRWTGGAIVEGAETVISLAGEALDTINVLETTSAELRAQGMTVAVQNARSVSSGRELVRELERTAALAESLRAAMEQNVRWARSLEIWRSRTVDSLRGKAERLDALPSLRKILDEGAKTWGADLKKTEEDSVLILHRINGLRKDLARGSPLAGLEAGTAMAAEDHARNRSRFEKILEEMDVIRELSGAAELFPAMEEDRAALLEAGKLAREGAETMKRNRGGWQSALSEFDRVRKALRRGYAHFFEKKGIPGWMIIGRNEQSVSSPGKKLPGEFGAWLETLLRMEEDIAKDLEKIPAADRKTQKETEEAVRRARILAADLLSRADAARKSLEETEEALGILLAAVKSAPRLTSLAVTVPAGGEPGKRLNFSADMENAPASAVVRWDFGDGTLAEGRTAVHAYSKEGSYKGSAVLLLEGKQAVRKDFSVKVVPAVSTAGQPGVLPVVPGVHEKIRAFFGLSDIPEGERKNRENVPNGYYLNTEILNSDCFLLYLTPEGKELKVSFKGGDNLPDPGANRLLAIAGTLAYNRKRSVVGFFLDGKNNLQERSPQDVYSGGTVVNYSVADLRLAPDPGEARRFHRARFGLDGSMTAEHLKAQGIIILTKGNTRISKRGPAAPEEFGTWVYGVVEGDFILNLSINRWSIRPDNWNPPAFDPDEAAWKIFEIFSIADLSDRRY